MLREEVEAGMLRVQQGLQELRIFERCHTARGPRAGSHGHVRGLEAASATLYTSVQYDEYSTFF